MSTNAHTPAHTLAMPVNTGLLAMRAANACKRLGLQPRDAQPAPALLATPATPERATAPRPPRNPAPAPAPEDALPDRAWLVLVAFEPQAGVVATRAFAVSAPGPRRAGTAARKAALDAGLSGLRGVVAVVREDAPTSVLAALAALA